MCIRDSFKTRHQDFFISSDNIFQVLGVPITDGDEAVSYTHLDVYKRQAVACPTQCGVYIDPIWLNIQHIDRFMKQNRYICLLYTSTIRISFSE